MQEPPTPKTATLVRGPAWEGSDDPLPFYLYIVSQNLHLYRKRNIMESRITKILMMVWAVLALASFVSGWFAPLFWGIVNWTFGGLNLMVIGSWTIATLAAKRALRKQQKINAEQIKVEEE